MTDHPAVEPCPWCDGDDIALYLRVSNWRCECEVCGASGPHCGTKAQAIAAWNRVAGQRWRPIETAPRDGTPLDLWVVPPSKAEPRDFPIFVGAHAHRIPDATPCYQTAWQSEGRTITGRRFYDDDGDECLDPDDTSVRATRATHWRPLPEPPEGEGK